MTPKRRSVSMPCIIRKDPTMSKPKFKIHNLDLAVRRRDVALRRLHEYYTAPAVERDKIDAAHPDGDAYNSLIDEVSLAHITYMFARG
jgi:hypothetical protein